MYLVLGFIIIFSGIGFLVFHRDSFIQNKSGQMAAKVLLFLLAFFVSIYGIGLSCFISVSQKEISGTVRILSCFLFTCTILWGLKASICFFYKNENMETVKADLKEFQCLAKDWSKEKGWWGERSGGYAGISKTCGKRPALYGDAHTGRYISYFLPAGKLFCAGKLYGTGCFHGTGR